MQSWNLLELETRGGTRSPIVLHSTDEARAVLIGIDPGQELGDHQVHEHAYIVIVGGEVQIEAGGERLEAGPGTLVRFEEKERHRVSSADGARLLMILAPWPGPGHYRGSSAERLAP
ncbi:MAG TPA: cupin domain-containing protein [Gaiellaceae bacterium]|nr:cupin domain-containing protein [Gaiellaceae bacterium]